MCDQINNLANRSWPLEHLKVRGNVLAKYSALQAMHELIPHIELADIITVDDDIAMFKAYSGPIALAFCINAILKNSAGHCAIWIIRQNRQVGWSYKLCELAVGKALEYGNGQAVQEIYEVINNHHDCLRLYANNSKLQNDDQFLYWIDVPDTYRGTYYCFTNDAVSDLKLYIETLAGNWKNMTDKWKVKCLYVLASCERADQRSAWEIVNNIDWIPIIEYLESLNHVIPGLVIPPMDISVRHYRLFEAGYTTKHGCDALIMHIIYTNDHMGALRNGKLFHKVIEVFNNKNILARLNEEQYTVLTERICEFWRQEVVGRKHEKGQYLYHLPLIKYQKITLPLARDDPDLLQIIVGQFRSIGHLADLDLEYHDLIVPHVPELITPKIFRICPQICIQTLEHNPAKMSNQLSTELLQYCYNRDIYSSLICMIPFKYISAFLTEDIRATILDGAKANFSSADPISIACEYMKQELPSDPLRALEFGLRAYGQGVRLDVLESLPPSCVIDLPLMHMKSLTSPAPVHRLALLLHLYTSMECSRRLTMDEATFCALVSDRQCHSDLMIWSKERADIGMYNVSEIVWTDTDTNFLHEMIRNDIIDYTTIKSDIPAIMGVADNICPICYEALTDSLLTECGHRFHTVCLSMWTERNTTCPLCRTPMTHHDDADYV